MRFDKKLSTFRPPKGRKPVPVKVEPEAEWKLTTNEDGHLIALNTQTGEQIVIKEK